MRAELHDGRVLEFPDGTDPAVIQATVRRVLAADARANAEAQTERDNKRFGDPTGSFLENVAAGAGKSIMDTGRGIGQLFGVVSQAEIDEANQRDKALMGTGGGLVGNIGGQVAQVAIPGTAALKVLPKVAGAAASGGLFAASQPVQQGDTRLGNTAQGAAFGAGGQAVASGVSALAKRGAASPQVQALYEKARAAGIPVNMAQLSDSRFLKTLQSTLERLPLTGAQGTRNAQQEAFNRAVSKTFGEDVPKVTRDVYAGAKGRIGGEFERLSSSNSLTIDDNLLGRLAGVVDESIRFADEGTGKAVRNVVEDLLARVDGSGKVPGKAYQSIDSKLGQLMRAGGEKAHYLGQVRQAVREAMDASISPGDKFAWDTARRQYANLKTVRDLVAKEGAEGDISPGLLMGRATANQAGKERMAMGRGGDLGELAMIGKQFVRDPVPDSATAQRMMTMGLLGGGGVGAFIDPASTAMAIGGPAVIGRALNAFMNSRAGQNYILRGGMPGLMETPAQLLPYAAPPLGLLELSQQ